VNRLILAGLLVLFASVPAFARNPARAVVEEVKLYGKDALALARAPLEWDAAMWKSVGLLAATDSAAFAADPRIADFVQRNRNSTTDDFAKLVTPLGGGRGLQISAATLLAGLLTHDGRLRDTGRDAIEASILAAGILTPAIKRVVGRSRPNAGEGAYAFDPLGNDESYPSGHATNAFAIASVFAAHSHGWVVPTIAYTLATSIAASRVNDNVHFTSDVIAGAAIGTMIGRSIVSRHRQPAGASSGSNVTWSITPMRGGVAVGVRFYPSRRSLSFARAVVGCERRISGDPAMNEATGD
jgi:membrane-associated phospholipid phosphatase